MTLKHVSGPFGRSAMPSPTETRAVDRLFGSDSSIYRISIAKRLASQNPVTTPDCVRIVGNPEVGVRKRQHSVPGGPG